MAADSLDIENRDELQAYLRANFAPAEKHEIREFRVLAGGVSSRTVLVELAGGQRWVLKQALAKLRVKADWFSDPVRVHREALGMRVLGELVPGRVPKLIFDDEQHHVLGMEAVPEPHENWKTMLLSGQVENAHATQFGELLGQIHNRSLHHDDFAAAFGDRSFFESLRVEPYYAYAASQEPRAASFLSHLIDDTRSTKIALVHGDFSPKNVLVHQGHIVLLDHEVIHFGDPAFDVGFALCHFLSKAHHLPERRADFIKLADAFWAAYVLRFVAPRTLSDASGDDYMATCTRHTLGCLLARVVGRSPLEYLSADERARQREAVVRLIANIPDGGPLALFERFVSEIER
jgi:aminoglycoside phosphotransferase (APT) family kinase protein